MDYLKYKNFKIGKQLNQRKKLANDTFNNAHTECSDKTAPTYVSEAQKSKSTKNFMNNFLESNRNYFNQDCDSNTIEYIDEKKVKNQTIYNNREKDINNKFIDNYKIQNFLTSHNNLLEEKTNNQYLKNFNQTRKNINDFLEESLLNKNIKNKSIL